MAAMRTFLVISLLLLVGCDPYRFTLIGHDYMKARIHSKLETVDDTERWFDVKEDGCVSLELPTATQYRISLNAQILEGEGFRVLARCRVEEQLIDSGVVISVTKKYARADKDGVNLAIMKAPVISTNNLINVKLYNDEKYLQVIVGCDTLLKYHAKGPSPDDLVITSIDSSTTRIYAPDWRDLEIEMEE
jgi:hypothetical protein